MVRATVPNGLVRESAAGGDIPSPRRRRKSDHGIKTPTETEQTPPRKPVKAPDQPVHKIQESLFSSASGYTNYRGFFNLALILLVVGNARLALENIIRYGILVSPGSWIGWLLSDRRRYAPVISLLGATNAFPLFALWLEKKLAAGQLSNRTSFLAYLIKSVMILVLPVCFSLYFTYSPFTSFFCLSIYSIMLLKLISYGMVNYWCRIAAGHSPQRKTDTERRGVQYPDNLTVSDLYYFMFAPTLSYQLNFPRLPHIRKWFLVKRLAETLFLSQVIIALCQQWILPTLDNSVLPFIESDYGRIVERLLKLAIPNHLIWLMFFYWTFHSFLNLTGELMRFGDREFYRDWWNSETIQYFWSTWNIPVHRWAARHMYKPMLRLGFGGFSAGVSVFFLSAFFHEYLVSVPLRMFRLWAFSGMLAQIPLNILTIKFLKGGVAGNILVWVSLILGQPLAILMYLHDYYVLNYSLEHLPRKNYTQDV